MKIIKSILVWFIGICFLLIFFPVTLLVWLLVLPFDRNRFITHRLLTLQSMLLVRILPIWKIKIEGKEKALREVTYVIISNHQSLIDILLINCLGYRFKWISKIENVSVPVLGWYLRMAGYITVNRNDEESKTGMLENSLECLQKGISIMIFPEGTRSKDKEIGFFKRGAFQLAVEANVPVLPIVIDGTGNILPKKGLMFSKSQRITLRVLDPVQPGSFMTNDVMELAERFKALISKELIQLRSISAER